MNKPNVFVVQPLETNAPSCLISSAGSSGTDSSCSSVVEDIAGSSVVEDITGSSVVEDITG